ncbi:MAG: hypothetical protein KJS90_08880 [Acidobacteria bacterium]|nr:hypothetical protein [Acidobacteriota bacterium]
MNGTASHEVRSIPSVATIRRTLVRRWWIAVPIVAACTGLLFSQESKLAVKPATVYMVRTYEVSSPLPQLAAIGIDPSAFAPLLSSSSAMTRFNNEDTMLARAERLGIPAELRIEQAPTDFAAIKQEYQESRSIYTLLVAGSNVFNLYCDKVDYEGCDAAANAGAEEFAAVLDESYRASTAEVARLIGLRADAVAATDRSGLSDAERAVLLDREVELRSQVAVLQQVGEMGSYSTTLLGETIIDQAATVDTVAVSTYAMGAIVGLLISVLVLLQLAVLSERRQRTTGR